MERHLGLIPSSESAEAESLVERIGRKLESRFDLDEILSIARSSKAPQAPSPPAKKRESKNPPLLGERERMRGTAGTRKVRMGIIRDRAFNFYYPENLEALADEGAQLIFIDSFKDRLPKVDGLYIGGGFPEFFLGELEGNRGLRGDIAEAVQSGLPVYAECAGLMYLCRSISWQNRSYKMVGVLSSEIRLSERPEGHGYVVAEVVSENPIFPVGLTVRGHEFHHSSLLKPDDLPYAYRMKRGRGIAGQRDGIIYKNLFASYIHLHALGTPDWAKGFVSLARKEKKNRRRVH
jgi:cobyrinic acid a,c-diamide synthase